MTGYDPSLIPEFMEAMRLEWEQKKSLFSNIPSIYFGGGTPYLLGPDNIAKILSWTGSALEITLEANPEDITLETMKAYKDAGINRVSIGVQSLNDDSLIQIGRNHKSSQTIEAINTTYKAGIKNITIDIMYDLPSQSISSFAGTLSALSNLPISHLSLYNMTIEKSSAFYRKAHTLVLPKEHESKEMLDMAVSSFEAIGLKRYEISAFAKPGFESNHNMGYWIGRPFLGLGPSAFSYTNGSRYQNIANWRKWRELLVEGKSPIDFQESLTYPNDVNELLAVHLRLTDGVSLSRFSKIPSETIAVLNELKKEGYLEGKNQFRLTEKGKLFYDNVASRII